MIEFSYSFELICEEAFIASVFIILKMLKIRFCNPYFYDKLLLVTIQ